MNLWYFTIFCTSLNFLNIELFLGYAQTATKHSLWGCYANDYVKWRSTLIHIKVVRWLEIKNKFPPKPIELTSFPFHLNCFYVCLWPTENESMLQIMHLKFLTWPFVICIDKVLKSKNHPRYQMLKWFEIL